MRNRIIAFNDYVNDVNGTTKYLININCTFNEKGNKSISIISSENITKGEFFSKKQSIKLKKLLIDAGYKDSIDIKLLQESVYYSVTPKLITPDFMNKDFGFQMRGISQILKIGDKIEYTDPKMVLNFDTLDFTISNSYYFKSKEDSEIFSNNNIENGYNYFLNKFKLLKY